MTAEIALAMAKFSSSFGQQVQQENKPPIPLGKALLYVNSFLAEFKPAEPSSSLMRLASIVGTLLSSYTTDVINEDEEGEDAASNQGNFFDSIAENMAAAGGGDINGKINRDLIERSDYREILEAAITTSSPATQARAEDLLAYRAALYGETVVGLNPADMAIDKLAGAILATIDAYSKMCAAPETRRMYHDEYRR